MAKGWVLLSTLPGASAGPEEPDPEACGVLGGIDLLFSKEKLLTQILALVQAQLSLFGCSQCHNGADFLAFF